MPYHIWQWSRSFRGQSTRGRTTETYLTCGSRSSLGQRIQIQHQIPTSNLHSESKSKSIFNLLFLCRRRSVLLSIHGVLLFWVRLTEILPRAICHNFYDSPIWIYSSRFHKPFHIDVVDLYSSIYSTFSL